MESGFNCHVKSMEIEEWSISSKKYGVSNRMICIICLR
jgi:hypothetical protein